MKDQEDVVVTQEDREAGFYWVLPVFNVDAGYEDGDPDLQNPQEVQAHWSNQEQPAYWTGEKWEMLGTEDWDVRWVGERVTRGCYEAGRRDMREGWVMVPREPTEAMLDGYWHSCGESKEMRARTHASARRRWSAMLEGIPTEPLGGEGKPKP